jgi:hypothetical protein
MSTANPSSPLRHIPFGGQSFAARAVTLCDGRSYHAMCAIDALGIPYVLREAGEIASREPDGRTRVCVTVDPDREPSWTPTYSVAVAAVGDGCCLAEAACPHINLFCSPDAATRYLAGHALRGSILSITGAATAGRWLFGELLESLDDAEST